MEENDLDISIDDWAFFAEGGAHIVLRNVNRSSHLSGLILRVPKGSDRPGKGLDSFERASDRFVDNVMRTRFARFQVISSRLIHLPAAFCDGILAKIDAQRPPGRKRVSKEIFLRDFGHLERNLFDLSVSPSDICVNKPRKVSIALEFKVKCGLLSGSPFLGKAHRRVKLRMSRYELMQHYKCARAETTHSGAVVWGEFSRRSQYDPRDLCSREEARVRHALSVLLRNPQNNLRILVDGKHVFGWDKSCESSSLAQTLPYGVSECLLWNVLCKVLCCESAFASLEALQAMDSLDSEGASVLYKRAVELAGDEQTMHAEYLRVLCERDNMDTYEESLFSSLRITGEDDEEIICSKERKAHELVQQMSLSQILRELRRWMIAYIAQDASIVIATSWNTDSISSLFEDCDGFRAYPQSEHERGRVCSKDDAEVLEYEVKLLDIGMKPFKKLTQRACKDEEICKIVSDYLCSHLKHDQPIW